MNKTEEYFSRLYCEHADWNVAIGNRKESGRRTSPRDQRRVESTSAYYTRKATISGMHDTTPSGVNVMGHSGPFDMHIQFQEDERKKKGIILYISSY